MTPVREQTPPTLLLGASAGGVEALRQAVGSLPPEGDFCVLVVLHLPPTSPSALPNILSRVSPWAVRHAADGERLRAREILVAPPNHHLLVLDGEVGLSRGPQENGHRPAIDVLFRSAARALGDRVMAAVLSGTLDDGAAGATAIATHGGAVVVQEFQDAIYESMPRAASVAVPDARQVPASQIGKTAEAWSRDLPGTPTDLDVEETEVEETMEMEVAMADLDAGALHADDRPGIPAGFGCPDCGGALYVIDEPTLRRYRCRVGHAWSPESLLARQTIAMESALWVALRSLEEKSALNTDLAASARLAGQETSARSFTERASEAVRAAELVRQLIAELDQAASERG